ncbi:dihydrodipicolinate reductase C-terminal domain-containing protein [Acinetobacter dispersus]|uniref:dihydrodipicolinate reductase C-terminal domain-containing protein n=1 Tax=Acinetobacter dispersus TaxID=70348 RepID=UPI0030081102
MANVYIIGSGKLAKELLKGLDFNQEYKVFAWADRNNNEAEIAIVVHAGSGRELNEAVSYCKQTGSTLIELSTDIDYKQDYLNIPVVLCPNTNILMLKFMNMIEKSGQNFSQYQISIIESHQANKTSVPGTAVAMAKSLSMQDDAIESVRDVKRQQFELGIPEQNLARHAYHRIQISDDKSCSIVLETKVLGDSPYVDGVKDIICAVGSNHLEKRLYDVMELIDNHWI